MNNNNSNIQIRRSALEVSEVREGLKATANSAEVRQEYTKVYPSIQSSNSLSSGLFPSRMFGEGQEYTHTRVAFVDVPKDMSKEDIQAEVTRLENAEGSAGVYKIFSYDVLDVMTATQIQAMESGLSEKDLDFYKAKYAVPDADGVQVVEDGLELYSSSHFNAPLLEDVDKREESRARLQTRTSVAEETNVKAESVITPAQM